MTTLDTRNTRGPDVQPPERRRFLGIRWTRKKIVTTIVAALVGLPALAFAAVYIFGLINGTTAVVDSDATIHVESVTGTGLDGADSGGVDCSLSNRHPMAGGGGFSPTDIDLNAKAYRVTVNGQPPLVGQDLGNCTVTVTVSNGVAGEAHPAPADVTAVVDPAMVPTGWTVVPSPAVRVQGSGGTGAVTFVITAKGTASDGTFPGHLSVTIPPAGAGSH